MIVRVREKRTGKDAILRVRDAVLSVEAFLLPGGDVSLVEHALDVGRLAGIEALAEHALNVFEEASDSALSWVQG